MVRLQIIQKQLELLKQYLDIHPEIRFCQALCNIGVFEYEPFRPNMSVRIPCDPYYTTNDKVIETLKNELN